MPAKPNLPHLWTAGLPGCAIADLSTPRNAFWVCFGLRFAFLLGFCLVLSHAVQAQYAQTFRWELQRVVPDSLYSLVGNVIPGTIQVHVGNASLHSGQWQFHPLANAWSLTDSSLAGSTVHLQFSSSPGIGRYRYRAVTHLYIPPDSSRTEQTIIRYQTPLRRSDVFGDSRVQRSGSLTRGITFGSNRDASLESGLRLDLSGYITDDLEILATLTDQSTPIQPDGSTQTLREFDQVFVRLKSQRGILQMGDIDVRLDRSDFARIDRRLQGGDIMIHTGFGAQRATASITRGQFRSQQFSGIEGVQGPYRLNGAAGETFIIVLAGSENVYIDGVRVHRGEENDYVIDYGLGEITFTPRRIIHAQTRITVDFQYLSQDYNRSLLAAEATADSLWGGRFHLAATVIREADSNNPEAQFMLNRHEIGILTLAGDDPQRAVVSGVISQPEPGTEYIRYVRRDTLVGGVASRLYVYSEDAEGAVPVRFSRTESGTGAYVRSGSAVNGMIYKWVGTGGDYDTLRTLRAPVERQMAALKSRLDISRNVQFSGEIAGSRFDQNRFSALDDEDNAGLAWKLGFSATSPQDIAGRSLWQLNTQLRSISSRFVFFDRPREIEFERIWNLPVVDSEDQSEQMATIESKWRPSVHSGMSALAGWLHRSELQSNRQRIQADFAEPDQIRFSWQGERVATSVSGIENTSEWWRQKMEVSRQFRVGNIHLTPFTRVEHEHRIGYVADSDTLDHLSIRFLDVNPGVQVQTGKWEIAASYGVRTDDLPVEVHLQRAAIAQTWMGKWRFDGGSRFRAEQEIGIRSVAYNARNGETQPNMQSIQTRSDVSYALIRNALDGQFNHRISSERRTALQERYFEVGPELGSYIWEDLNGDGIQDIDEFFLERLPGEGTFILQYVPGDSYIPVTTLDVRWRNRFRFDRIYSKERNLLSHIELASRFDLRESGNNPVSTDLFLLRISNFQNPLFIQQGRIFTQHEVLFRREGNGIGARLVHEFMKASNRLANGLEQQNRKSVKLEGEWASGSFLLSVPVSVGTSIQRSERMPSRAFYINSAEISPRAEMRFSKKMVAATTLRFMNREDQTPAREASLTAWDLESEITIYHTGRGRTRIVGGRRMNKLRGETNFHSIYELTDGGAAGAVWSISMQNEYRIRENIRAMLSYDMRSIPGRSVLQTVRFVVSAML